MSSLANSLVFGALTSDRVDCGSGTNLDDIDPFTALMWCYPTTLTTGRALYDKGVSGQRRLLELADTSGNLDTIVSRGTANSTWITTSAPLVVTTWCCVAWIFSSAASPCNVFYQGTLALPLAASTGTNVDGSGALKSDAAGNLVWGNKAFSTFNVAFRGSLAFGAVFGAVLTLAQCQSWQRRPRVTVGGNVAAGFWRFGNEGATTQQDYSGNGNAGTTTGATQDVLGPALDQGELTWGEGPSGLWRPERAGPLVFSA